MQGSTRVHSFSDYRIVTRSRWFYTYKGSLGLGDGGMKIGEDQRIRQS